MKNIGYLTIKTLDVCEYPLARNIILLAVAIATESLITFIESRQKYSYILTLKDLKIQIAL
jgi:hypothetical protein